MTQLPDTKVDRSFLIHGDVHTNGAVLDDRILADVDIRHAIDRQGIATKSYKVVNTDRSIGARISGAIALKYGDSAFEGQLTLNFQGAAGQSFGAFNHEGVSLNLTGESNDYVGKGINGGEIVKWQRVQTAAGEQQLKDLIAAHGAKTGSQKAQEILSRWAEYLPKFWQLVPPSEAETPEASAKQAVSA